MAVAANAARPLDAPVDEPPGLGVAARGVHGLPLAVRVSRDCRRGARLRGLPTGHQPTDPSIWSSMRRLSSMAYSIGSSLTIGSTKPLTTILAASSSVMPRDIR